MSQTSPENGKKRKFPAIFLLPLIVFGALVALFLAQMMSGRNPNILPSALIDKPAPEFNLPAVPGLKRDGQDVPGFKREDLIGKVTVANLFGSWCGPCRAEHEYLIDLSKQAEAEGFQVAGLNYKDEPANAVRFLDTLGNPFDLVGMTNSRAGIEWGVTGVPETFIIDRKGQIRYKYVGPLNEASYRDVFLPELKKVLSTQ